MEISTREKISSILKERKITQRKLAKKMGVSEVSVSRWLNGERNPNVKILAKFAHILKIPASQLLADENLGDDFFDDNDSKNAVHSDNDADVYAFFAGAKFKAAAVIGVVAIAKASDILTDADKIKIKELLDS